MRYPTDEAEPEMQRVLSELGISPDKRRGQHFLRSPEIAHLIIDAADIGPDDTVLEIGPGLGILTFPLAERAGTIIAVELEPAFSDHLNREAKIRGIHNLTVLRGDALFVELPEFDKVVSNLPYNISSPLTFRLLPLKFERGVLMYQKELGSRLIMSPGTNRRGAPTFKANYYADIVELFKVPAGEFHPVPAVDSIVVGIRKRSFPHEIRDRAFYFRLIDILFQQRRKKLRNTLMLGFMKLPGVLGISKESFKEVIRECIPEHVQEKRPEELEVVEMVGMANSLYDRITE